MSEAKFTKGEWRHEGDACIYSKVSETSDVEICSMIPSNIIFSDEDITNAHLIAAAPEMYEMLDEVSRCLSSNHESLRDEIYNLLAKARGESND